MKLYIFLLLSLFIFVSAQAQKTKQKPFVPDKYGYVKDPKFHALIKQKGYELVGAYNRHIDNAASVLLNASGNTLT